MKSLRWFHKSLSCAVAAFMAASCSVNRFIPEGSYLLERVSISADTVALNTQPLQGFVRQRPNSRWFSALPIPLSVYCLSGTDSTRRFNRFLRRLGEAPVIYDSTMSRRTSTNMEQAVRSMGYLNARVVRDERVRRNRLRLRYEVHPGDKYRVRNLSVDILDSALEHCLAEEKALPRLHEGMDFDLNVLDEERGRISSVLSNNGYYRFNKDFIRYEADTTVGHHQVDLRMMVLPYRVSAGHDTVPHSRYRLNRVDFQVDTTRTGRPFLRHKALLEASRLEPGNLYREADVQETYARMIRLGAVLSTNVHLQPSASDSTGLDAVVQVARGKRNSFGVEVEGTNSAGDFGAALSTSYQNRNVFRGSETFSVKLRGAFEAIKGLSGYQDQNYIEYSAETGLSFPGFRAPFVSRAFRQQVVATSEVSLMYDSQDRPEFHRRVVTAAWKYRWSRPGKRLQHRVDLLDLNYVFMPWISSTFRKLYLDDPENRNAILRYNYENLFIMKWGYSMTYNSRSIRDGRTNYGTNGYIIRMGVESSGNLLYGLSKAGLSSINSMGQYTLFNIAYAQYVKADFDYSKSFYFDKRNSLALHFGVGVAFPYGNSTILPYEKRYFSGGANSVRGWSVRGLGPGSFRGNDGRIDFINQTGDLKLDMNAGYRARLFWKLDGVLFVDAGNIWTLRDYADQPGGQFRVDSFWRQIAVAYGLGVRLNFEYFILRLDGGMKAVHPAYTDSRRHFPIVHPNFGRDFSLHFAVGLPF